MHQTKAVWRKMILIGAAIACFAGCVRVKYSYKLAPWWARTRLLASFNADTKQVAAIAQAVDSYFEWHRAKMLPEYARFARRLAALATPAPQTAAQGVVQPIEALELLQGMRGQARMLCHRALIAAAPPIAAIFATIRPEQVPSFAKGLEHALDRSQKAQTGSSPAETRARKHKKIIAAAEDWLGPVSGSLRQHIEAFADIQAKAAPVRLAARAKHQAMLVADARAKAEPAQFEKDILEWIKDLEVEPIDDPAVAEAAAAFQSMTSTQRDRLRMKLEELAGDVEDLSK